MSLKQKKVDFWLTASISQKVPVTIIPYLKYSKIPQGRKIDSLFFIISLISKSWIFIWYSGILSNFKQG